jgi:hypothetical protein
LAPSNEPRTEYVQYTVDDLLDATANILVRDIEIIAVGVSGCSIGAMQGQKTGTTGGESDAADEEPGEKEPDAEDEGELDDEEPDSAANGETDPEQADYSDILIPRIAAIVNPDEGDDYDFPENCQCILVSGGESYLPQEYLSGNQLCQHLFGKIQ